MLTMLTLLTLLTKLTWQARTELKPQMAKPQTDVVAAGEPWPVASSANLQHGQPPNLLLLASLSVFAFFVRSTDALKLLAHILATPLMAIHNLLLL